MQGSNSFSTTSKVDASNPKTIDDAYARMVDNHRFAIDPIAI
jgi:hypothetical protein